MNKVKSLLVPFSHLFLVVVVLLLLYGAKGFRTAGPALGDIFYISEMSASVDGGPWETVSLPHNFKNLEPRTPVVLTTSITPSSDDTVYIKSVCAPANIYLDGTLVYRFGLQENYPAFMADPATEVHMVETHGHQEPMELRIEFLSPVSRRTLTVHTPMLGSSKQLISERQHMLGLSLSFALLQCFVGVGLILIAVYIMLLDKKAVIFFWLGLFALATGVWAFGENNFTHIVFKNTAALYLLSFIGFFTFMIPLLRFVSLIVNFKDPRPIRYTELGLTFCAALALLLQLFGLVSCSSSMYVFHIILPVILVLLTVLTAREATRYHNRNARRMLLPIGVLVLSAVLELCNYRFLFTLAFSSVFQVGIITFLLCMGIIGGLFIKDSLDLKDRQKELAFEKSLVNIQIKEQKERGFLLAHKEQILRQQRHDLRHHLAAIQELAWEENTELQNYLKTLMDQIPKPEERFCENRAVNAVIAHYVQICDTSGINFTVRLVVPPCGDGISDNELCVIFGNLLENAVEACNRLVRGPRFIKLNSSLQFNILTITMDNSFTGELITENGRFRSAKRDDYGIGIASIQSVAEKYSGDAEFKSSGKVFFSSVYLTI